MNRLKKAIWLSAGMVCLALGLIGVVLPILPTTPFMLLAAFFFAKSSKRLHNWLVSHRTFGPPIKDWHLHGAISRTAKTGAILTMMVVLALSVLMSLKFTIIIIQALAMLGSATFILTRPSPPIDDSQKKTNLKPSSVA